VKRVGNLLDAVADWQNLRLAAAKALRGKRGKADARLYLADLDANLRRLGEQLRAGSVPVGRFHQFTIHDPKERLITAPCFEERALHHAIMNVCEPVLERWLIADTFACRRGKGRVACLQRAQAFARRFPYFLKQITEREAQQRGEALVAFTRTPGVKSWWFRRSAIEELMGDGHGLGSRAPRRQLDQQRQELPVGLPQQERAGQPEPELRVPPGRSSNGDGRPAGTGRPPVPSS
jgi:hypothetical protein